MYNFGLDEYTIKILSNYFSTKKELEKVLVYGSRAKGAYRRGSDIDFAIIGKNLECVRILAELEDLPLPYKFDVVDYDTITNPALKSDIDSDGKIFYSKQI